MKLSINWLNEYLNIHPTAEQLAEILTGAGLEVEGSETTESVKGGLKGLVTGRVVSCEKHPDADKLSVTTVDTGTGELLQIVCGAPNVAAGQNVVVATVGTKLYKGTESFEIKKSKIRGVESQGMLCAEDEIGLGTGHDGILVLPENIQPGTPAAEHFRVSSDTVLELNITPNRSDATSHIGAARDVVACLRLKDPSAALVIPPVDDFTTGGTTHPVEIAVENQKDCPRYCGITVSGIKVEASPEWLRNRLKSIGLKPVNNVVDITNFVLHETGQPLHAFDLAAIDGKKVIVRSAEEGTAFTTLDGVERKLSASDLVICNVSGPMCIAGVLGGINSGVSESTTAVFLESAYFNPVSIRKTAKRHGIHSDASFRFERGANPAITLYALKRAAMMIRDICGGTISSEPADHYPVKKENAAVALSFEKINAITGQDIPEKDVLTILEALEIKVTANDGKNLSLEIPSFKVEVTRDVDVVEEILRIYGYNEITIHTSLKAVFNGEFDQGDRHHKKRIAGMLTASGFYEMLTNSLSNSMHVEKSGAFLPEQNVKVLNPISSELDIMRRSMLFSGLEVIVHNINHRSPDLKLFEFGKTYHTDDSATPEKPRDRYKEQDILAVFITGNVAAENWHSPVEKTGFFDLKGVVTSLLDALKVPYKTMGPTEDKLFENGFSIAGFGPKKETLVTFGTVSGAILKQFDIRQQVGYAEFNWQAVLAGIPSKPTAFADIARFPAVRRDLALLIDKGVTYESIRQAAFGTDKNILKDVKLFDVYEGKNIPENKKSYAVSFKFQDVSKTLTDQEIDKIMEKLIRNFGEKLGAEIRQ